MKRLIPLIALSLLSSFATVSVQAQEWPTRPVKIMNGGGPGSPLDIYARMFAQRLEKKLGQPVIIENRPGANQLIVADQCAKAAPDGYTLCMVSQEPITNNPFMFKSLPYDVERGFSPIAMLAMPVSMVFVNAQTGVKTLQEAIALSKKSPGKLNWGSYGIGSASHLYLESIRHETGWDVTHVPFTDPTLALTALLRNEVQFIYSLPNAQIRARIESGEVIPLVYAGAERHPVFPNVPTFAEVGLGKYFVRGLWGMLGPAGLPPAVVEKMNRLSNEVMQDPGLDQTLNTLSLVRRSGTPTEMAEAFRTMREQLGPAFKRANVQPN